MPCPPPRRCVHACLCVDVILLSIRVSLFLFNQCRRFNVFADIKRVMEEKEHLKQQHSGQQSQYQRNHVVQHQQRPVSASGIHVTSATDSSRPHCVHPPSREAPEPLHIERSSPSVINIVRVAERNHLPRKKPTSCVAPPATLIAHGTRRVVIETLPRTTESSPSPRTCPAVSTKNTLLDERT